MRSNLTPIFKQQPAHSPLAVAAVSTHEPSCALAPLPFLLVSFAPRRPFSSVSQRSQSGQDELEDEARAERRSNKRRPEPPFAARWCPLRWSTCLATSLAPSAV
jgi:hypothetical protein